MLTCPSCSRRLARSSSEHGAIYPCRTCGGKAVAVSVLKKTAGTDFLRMLRHKWGDSGPQNRRCPLCAEPMVALDFGRGDRPVTIDVCRPCRIVWFDRTEQDKLAPVPTGGPPPLPGPGDDRSGFALTRPDSAWQILPAVLGLPVEFGPNRLQRRPVLTWALTAGMAMVLVWLLAAGGRQALADAIQRWGFIPNDWQRDGGLTLVTSFFLHVGWWHLIANGYFLVIFGDNVEDHLGRGRFLLLLAAAHLGGIFLHSALAARGDVPCVGASAGISGVIAYYAIVFPRAKVGIFLWWWTLFHILRMPALVALLLYVAVQAVGAYLAWDSEVAGVAYLAHLGGLAVGAAAGLLALIFLRDHGPRPT